MSMPTLFDFSFIDPDLHEGPFQMQSYSPIKAGLPEHAWKPMENGPAPKVWRPRKTAREAVVKCLTWTGIVCIPAMQVVDLATGDVVWRGVSEFDPEAGEPVTPSWTAECIEEARAALREPDEVSLAAYEASRLGGHHE